MAGLFIDLLEVIEKEFKKQIGAPTDISSAEKSALVRRRGNERNFHILNKMEEFSEWTVRNHL